MPKQTKRVPRVKQPVKQLKTWRRQKQAPAKARKGFETAKQMRADPRMGHNGDTHCLELENQIEALIQPISVNIAVLEEWARGFVDKALEKGFMSLAELPSYPYYAYIYTVKTMMAIISNTPQLSIRVPYAMLAVCRALQSKEAPFGIGEVSYTTIVDQYVQPTVTKVVGYPSFGYTWSIGTPTGPLVNVRFPTLDNVIGGYTDQLGATAFQRLCQILIDDNPDSDFKMVGAYDPTSLDKDVSAFAYARGDYERIGLTSSGVLQGGYSTSLNLEVPIFRPQFAALGVEGFVPSQVQRFGNLHANCAGDATFLAAGQATWFTEEKWRMQRPPKIHPIDFNEFGDVVGKWVAGIQQAYLEDATSTNSTLLPTVIAGLQCPLTLQETCLILRNVLMTAFKKTQAGTHALYPIVPASDSDNVFVPFVVGSNTCFLAPTDMSLPIPLIENIRSLVDRLVWRGGSDWEVFIPSLGIWSEEVLQESNYFYTFNGVETSSFKPAASFAKKKVETIEGLSYVPLVETVVSLVDGSSPSGMVCINDPEALKFLTSQWESWLKTSGLATFSCPLGVLGTEAGINALTSINMSRVSGDVLDAKHKEIQEVRAKQTKNIVETRFHSKTSVRVSSVYDTVNAVLDTSQAKILATAYEQIQSVWILPCIRTRQDANNIITPLRWAAIQDEPYSHILLNGGNGQSLDSLHASFVAKLVRGKLQPKTDWDELFSTLAAKGRGGILSGLVSKFADAIIPGAGNIVKEIGGAIGI